MSLERAMPVWQTIKESGITLAAIDIPDWNRSLSPWKAPALMSGDEDFSGCAEQWLENIEKEISSLKFKQHTNEFDYNNIIKKLEEKARIEEELQNSLEEKDELLKLEKEITIAKIAIERAYEKMKNEITPKFTKNLSNIVDKISNGKYNKIKFVDGEGRCV